MAGKSFMVTVSAPNAPCRHTHNKVTVGHQGLSGGACPPSRWARRSCTQEETVMTMISTPTPVARYRWIISIQALPWVTGPVGMACWAAEISARAPTGLALP